ncbi:MAG: hypothetical protein OEW11_11230 [Nitrospirota bacterium]|nr:hypothetical protein [Nitrospirota bacterium]
MKGAVIQTVPASGKPDPWAVAVGQGMARHLYTPEAADLKNGWLQHGSYNTLRATKSGHVVMLEGVAKGGTAGTTVWYLPEGWRPLKVTRFPSGVTLDALGGITPDSSLGTTAVSFQGLFFLVV